MAVGEGEKSRSNGAVTAPQKGLQADSKSEEIWDEERLEKAMHTLKEMHINVRLS